MGDSAGSSPLLPVIECQPGGHITGRGDANHKETVTNVATMPGPGAKPDITA